MRHDRFNFSRRTSFSVRELLSFEFEVTSQQLVVTDVGGKGFKLKELERTLVKFFACRRKFNCFHSSNQFLQVCNDLQSRKVVRTVSEPKYLSFQRVFVSATLVANLLRPAIRVLPLLPEDNYEKIAAGIAFRNRFALGSPR